MLYDISPLISSDLAVFPGDTTPTREVLLDLDRGDHLTLSTFRGTVHLGAHADAPSHYGRRAATIDEVPLETYWGPCQVIRVAAAAGARLTPADLTVDIAEPRVLLATGSYPDPRRFNTDFVSLAPELVDWLAERGVRLLGIDTPSVDPATSEDLPAHQAFLRRGLSIIEGLLLHDVPEGRYELVALPLKLQGFDASPVRAALRTLD